MGGKGGRGATGPWRGSGATDKHCKHACPHAGGRLVDANASDRRLRADLASEALVIEEHLAHLVHWRGGVHGRAQAAPAHQVGKRAQVRGVGVAQQHCSSRRRCDG